MGQLETVGSGKPTSEELVISSPRGVDRRPYDLKVGDSVHGFTVSHQINDFV
jgi:hypothetical protein